VQTVLRPNVDYRGYAGQITSGVVRRGDALMALPSRKVSCVVAIDTYERELDVAFAPMSVSLRLGDDIDISRGDLVVHPNCLPRVGQRFDAMLVWLHERPLDRAKSYLVKHTTQTVRAQIEAIAHGIDLETLEEVPVAGLGLNDIGRVTVHTRRPLFFDTYKSNRTTGAFIVIDSLTNDTVAAGVILADTSARVAPSAASEGAGTHVSPLERRARLGHASAAVVVRAPSLGQGRAVGYAVERLLFDRGCVAVVVAGEADDSRAAEAAEAAVVLCVQAGLVAVLVVPFGAHGEGDRSGLGGASVLEVHATGAPEHAGDAHLVVDAADPDRAAEAVVQRLEAEGLLGER
jgi:hypothetical protein